MLQRMKRVATVALRSIAVVVRQPAVSSPTFCGTPSSCLRHALGAFQSRPTLLVLRHSSSIPTTATNVNNKNNNIRFQNTATFLFRQKHGETIYSSKHSDYHHQQQQHGAIDHHEKEETSIVEIQEDRNPNNVWRALLFRNTVQSVVKWNRQTSSADPTVAFLSYIRVMLVAGMVYSRYLNINLETSRILCIGLGGGTVPRFLNAYFPRASIDVVEIDRNVYEIAKKYLGFQDASSSSSPSSANIRIYIEDALLFLRDLQQQQQQRTSKSKNKNKNFYDVIFVDAYDHEFIPAPLTTPEFITDLWRSVGGGGTDNNSDDNSKHNEGDDGGAGAGAGLVVINVHSNDEERFETVVGHYRQVFGDKGAVAILGVPNTMTRVVVAMVPAAPPLSQPSGPLTIDESIIDAADAHFATLQQQQQQQQPAAQLALNVKELFVTARDLARAQLRT